MTANSLIPVGPQAIEVPTLTQPIAQSTEQTTPQGFNIDRVKQARDAGYSDDEIISNIENSKSPEAAKIKQAKSAGYTSQQIVDQLTGKERPLSESVQEAPEKSLKEKATAVGKKAGRLAMQAGIGAGEAATLTWDLLVSGARISKALSDAVTSGPEYAPGIPVFGLPTGGAEFASSLPTFGESIENLFSKFGIEAKPQGAAEKTVRLASLFRKGLIKKGEEAALQGADRLSKYLTAKGSEQLRNVAAHAPLAATSVATEEIFGVPEWASLLGISLGSAGARAAWELGKEGTRQVARKYLLMDPKNFKSRGAFKAFQDEVRRGPEEARKQLKEGLISPQQYERMKPYLDIAQQYGIPLTPSTITDSARFKRIERIIARREMTEEAAQKFRQEAADKWARSYEHAIADMATSAQYNSRAGLAEALATDVTRKKHAAFEETVDQLYGKADKLLAKAPTVSEEGVQRIEQSLDDVYQRLGESRIPTSAEQSARGIAERGKGEFATAPTLETPTQAGRPELENVQFPIGQVEQMAERQSQAEVAAAPGRRTLMQARARQMRAQAQGKKEKEAAQAELERIFGKETAQNMELTKDGHIRFKRGAKALSARQLQATIRSLNNTLQWDQPAVVNLLGHPRQVMKEVFETEYSKKAPDAYKYYTDAQKTFGEMANLFGKDARWHKWGLRQDMLPNELLATIDNLERFKAFERDFGKDPQGAALINYMKRKKVEEMLAPIFNKDVYSPGSISSGLRQLQNDPDKAAQFAHFASDESKKNLNKLAKLDKRIAQTAGGFYKGAAERPDLSDLQGLWYTISNPTQWAFKFANKVSKDRIADAYAKIYTDPTFTKEMAEIGEETLQAFQSKKTPPSKVQDLIDRIEQFWDDIATEVNLASTVAPSRIAKELPPEER